MFRSFPLFDQKPGQVLANLEEFGTFAGFYVVWASTFWHFCRILRRVGEHFLALLEDFTSCGRALFGTFGGFYVVRASTFWHFCRILCRVGEHFLAEIDGF